ncbi:MAG: hypothetical protein KAJ03_01900 [Gammaproteobacteria bacterium]|nr:hypothetical protein [Gammaproteobacteria bacterium]
MSTCGRIGKKTLINPIDGEETIVSDEMSFCREQRKYTPLFSFVFGMCGKNARYYVEKTLVKP